MQVRDVFMKISAIGDMDIIHKMNDGIDGAIDSANAMGTKLKDVGKGMSKYITAPIVGIGTASIGVVKKFDDSMKQVQSISGALPEQYDELREKAKQLGNDTAYSASDAADGMGILASSGMKVNSILETSESMLDLMSAGAVDANTAASVLTNTMAQFGVAENAEGAKYIADTFAQGAASAQLGVEDLEYAMAQAGGAMSSMNMNATDSVAAVGQLANAGMPIGQVGTALNAMTREIKANADEFKSHGINVYDEATGDLREMGQVMEDLEVKLKGKTDAERDSILSTVFSGQAQKAATDWINQGSEAYDDLSSEIHNAKDASNDMAATNEDNIGGAFRSMSSKIETLLITIGDILAPVISKAADFIGDLTEKFTGLDDGTQIIIVGIGIVAAAAGPLIGAIGMVMESISLTTLIIGGLIAAGVKLYHGSEEFREKFHSVIDNIKDMVSIGVEFIGTVWENHGEKIMIVAEGAWDIITNIINVALDVINGAVDIFSGLMSSNWEQVWDGVKQITGGFIDFMLEIPGQMLQIGKDIISGLIDGIKSMASSAVNTVKGVAGEIAGEFKGFFGIKSPSTLMMEYGHDIVDGLSIGIDDEAPELTDIASLTNDAIIGNDDNSIINNSQTSKTIKPDITINIHQQPGESSTDLAEQVKAILNSEIRKASLQG